MKKERLKMKRVIAMALGVVMLCGMVGCGNTETAKKKETYDTFVAGFGKTIITPEYEVHMASHGDEASRVSQGILTDLYALVVAMSDTEGNTMLWITTDVTQGNIVMADLVRKEVEEKYGIPKENVLLKDVKVALKDLACASASIGINSVNSTFATNANVDKSDIAKNVAGWKMEIYRLV